MSFINRFKLLSLVYYWPQMVIVLVWLFLVVANYVPGTWLSGWDALHPEFNFSLYFQRILNVWQDHQGLGAPPAQAHLSELPRMLLYYPMSWVLPDSFLRYGYFFVCLLLGPLGVYAFLTRAVFGKKNLIVKISGLVTSLVYLLNLTVLQQFYVPLEMFATHYASIGWLFLYAFLYLKHHRRRDLVVFCLLTFFSASMAHTATLWYVYFGCIGLFIFLNSFGDRPRWRYAIYLTLVTLVVNAFWLLPNAYYVINHSSVVKEAKISRSFSQEAFLNGAEYGTLMNLITQKNFLFNWQDYDVKSERFVPIFDEWESVVNSDSFAVLWSLIFILSLNGMIYAYKKRNLLILSIIPLWMIGVFFWFNINPPLGFVYQFLRDNISLFREGFRFPFTKWSIVYIFSLSVLVGYAVEHIGEKLQSRGEQYYRVYIGSVCVIILWMMMMFNPAFRGYLISDKMKVWFPDAYFEMFEWFDRQDEVGKIANFPIESMWGWKYYDWNYQGAGFLWFGLKQPLMDREFDRWYPTNEQYYREMSSAVYAQDADRIVDLAKKFNISWFLLDKSVISPGNDPDVLYFDELEQMFGQSDEITLIEQFGDDLFVFEISDTSPSVYSMNTANIVSSDLDGGYRDSAYLQNGDYIQAEDGLIYPLRLLAGKDERLYNFDYNDDLLTFSFSVDDLVNYDVVIPEVEPGFRLPVTVSSGQNNVLSIDSPYLERLLSLNVDFDTVFVVIDDTTVVPYGAISQDEVFMSVPMKDTYLVKNSNNELFVNQSVDYDNVTVFGCDDDVNSIANYSFFVDELDQIVINNREGTSCVVYPLDVDFGGTDTNNGKILIDISFQSKNGSDVCFLNNRDGLCFESSSYQVGDFNHIVRLFDREEVGDIQLQWKIVNHEEVISDLAVKFYDRMFRVSGADLELDYDSLFRIFGEKITFEIPVHAQTKNFVDEPSRIESCGTLSPLISSKSKSGGYLELESLDGSTCESVYFSVQKKWDGGLLFVDNRTVTGLPGKICLNNSISGKCDLLAFLSSGNQWLNEVYQIPATFDLGSRYRFNIDTISVGRNPSINQFRRATIAGISEKWLNNIVLVPKDYKSLTSSIFIRPHSGFGNWFLINELEFVDGQPVQGLFVLNNSFESGWKAIYFDGIMPIFLDHVKVNNWANGWEIKSGEGHPQGEPVRVYIFFWPQILQYLGFALLGITLIWIWKKGS